MKNTAFLVLLIWCTLTRAQSLPYIFDMVHHNPGEVRFVTNYDNPEVIKSVGMNGKVFFLFDSGVLGLNWNSFDPDILPAGTTERIWVDEKAAETKKKYDEAKKAGLQVYCMSDLILFPKRLVEKYGMQTSFKNIQDTLTQKMLRLEIRMMFQEFPQLDGIVVRIGETYMQDAPYHVGGIDNKSSVTTIVPLIQILREEVCQKLNKKVFFRTWLSFDTNLTTYNQVSNAIEPHDNLIFSVKHCEGDFHRGNPFSKVLGAGRHKQIVEVQCAREYEGKGAFPNYIADGVINGFEEYQNTMAAGTIQSLKQLYQKSPLFSGVWTWSKGGGWDGPYMSNDFWNELNTWVMSHWAQNPTRSEEEVFNDYVTNVLKLSTGDLVRFRKLAIYSAQAVIRGRRSTFADTDQWWTRDHYIGAPPVLPANTVALNRVLSEKKEAVTLWNEIVTLADQINLPDAVNRDFMRVSARYGLYLHQIYAIAFELKNFSQSALTNRVKIDSLIVEYDNTWSNFNNLKTNNPSCATLYKDLAFRNTTTASLREFIGTLRNGPLNLTGKYIKNLSSGIATNVITLETNPAVGKKIYNDRSYNFTNVPAEIANAEYVVWKNDYKNYTSNPMLTFSLQTDCKVYIAHDDRLIRPDWLVNKYTKTDLSIAVNDTRLTLFEASFKKDDVVSCGVNHTQGNLNTSTQYLVFVAPDKPSAINHIKESNLKIINTYSGISLVSSNEYIGTSYSINDYSGKRIVSGIIHTTAEMISLKKGFYIISLNKKNIPFSKW